MSPCLASGFPFVPSSHTDGQQDKRKEVLQYAKRISNDLKLGPDISHEFLLDQPGPGQSFMNLALIIIQ